MGNTVSSGTGFGNCVRCGVALLNGCIITNAGNECGVCMPREPGFPACPACPVLRERAEAAESRVEELTRERDEAREMGSCAFCGAETTSDVLFAWDECCSPECRDGETARNNAVADLKEASSQVEALRGALDDFVSGAVETSTGTVHTTHDVLEAAKAALASLPQKAPAIKETP